MKGFVYILRTSVGTKYIGSTKNLDRRLKEHMEGKVFSTKNKLPLKLVAYREFEDVKEAAVWEKKYKNSSGQVSRDLKDGKLITD